MQLDYARIVLSLLISVAIGVAIIYAMSRYGHGRGHIADKTQRIQVLEARPLGNRTSLVAVNFRNQEFLLVVGPGFATVVSRRDAIAAEQTSLAAEAAPHA